MQNLRINKARLEKNLFELAKIGKNEHGGIDRALGSDADYEARKWLQDYWEKKLGIPARLDAIANMWVKRPGTEDLVPIVIGSHHDAVPDGGMYDGALGVLGATEILQTMIENHIQTRHPIEVVSFTGEEPNPYNVSTLGSKVLSGRLVTEDLKKLSSYLDGSSLAACIAHVGGNIEQADSARIHPGDICAFIELHIEQGKRLYNANLTSAAVNCITGIYRENITVYGEANHAGTTIMQDRTDAFLAASEFALAYEKIVRNEQRDDVVGTIGYVKVSPNAASIIPGKVELVMELRCCDEAIRQRIKAAVTEITAEIEKERGVRIERKLNLDQKEMWMDRTIVEAVKRGIDQEGKKPLELVSMAGHDAANMQRVTKSAMIFVQSIDGKSHCPQEKTDINRIEETVNAMLDAVLILDKEMDAI